MDEQELRRLFEAYTSPYADLLSLVLGDVQKERYPAAYSDWKAFVLDVMEAMELHDSGQFPDSWFPDDDPFDLYEFQPGQPAQSSPL